MRRLRDFQHVSLYVGQDFVEARAAAAGNNEAVLALAAPLPDDLTLPIPAQLSFQGPDGPVLLRGMLSERDGGALRFSVNDGFGRDPRRSARLALAVSVQVTLASDATVTA